MSALLERIATGPIMATTIARGPTAINNRLSDNFAHLLDSPPVKNTTLKHARIAESRYELVTIEPKKDWWSKLKEKTLKFLGKSEGLREQPIAQMQKDIFQEHTTSKRWLLNPNYNLSGLSTIIVSTIILCVLPGLYISSEVDTSTHRNFKQDKNYPEASAPAPKTPIAVTIHNPTTPPNVPMPEYETYEIQGEDYLFKLFNERKMGKDMRTLYEFMRLNSDYFDVSKIKDKEFFNGHDVNRMFKQAKKLKPGMQLRFLK